MAELELGYRLTNIHYPYGMSAVAAATWCHPGSPVHPSDSIRLHETSASSFHPSGPGRSADRIPDAA